MRRNTARKPVARVEPRPMSLDAIRAAILDSMPHAPKTTRWDDADVLPAGKTCTVLEVAERVTAETWADLDVLPPAPADVLPVLEDMERTGEAWRTRGGTWALGPRARVPVGGWW